MPDLFNVTATHKGPVRLFEYAQSVAPFAELTVGTVFILFMLIFRRYPLGNSLPAASFFAFFTAMTFYLLGMLNESWLWGTAALTAGGVMLNYWTKSYS
jgi:hypothetical protein